MNPLEHETQRRIILKLIHNPEMGFNELWNKEGESNTFAYHMGKLEGQEYIEKADSKYRLTQKGKRLSALVEGDTGQQAAFPTLTILLVVRNGEKYLCQRRLKEPFYGYWSYVSGKVNFGLNMFECASRDIEDETGLRAAEWKFKGIEQVKTFEKERLLFHHYIFVLEAKNISGELRAKTHKAEHAWLTLAEFHSKEGFPGHWCSEHIALAEHPVIVEGERYMEDGRFTGAKLVSVRKS